MQELLRILSYQSKIEWLLALYFFTLLFYMLIVFGLKHKHKKSISIYMFKHKDTFCWITFVILIVYVIIGSFISDFYDKLSYIGCMTAAMLIVNYVFIQGYGIKKIKDVEFKEISEAYDDIINYCTNGDKNWVFLNEFILYLTCQDNEDEIGTMNFTEFGQLWLSLIINYLEDRIKAIDFIEIPDDKNVLYNYVKDKILKENLWHNVNNISDFVKDILNNEEVVLTSTIRIIPISSKRFNCLLYVSGKRKIEDMDRSFLVNTYKILSLL